MKRSGSGSLRRNRLIALTLALLLLSGWLLPDSPWFPVWAALAEDMEEEEWEEASEDPDASV